MPNVNLYRGGGRSPLGGQVARIPSYAAKPDDIITPKSAWASFGADMVRALTAKAQENRERKDQAVFMAAATAKGFDPSKMAPMEEESPYVAAQRATMAQALQGRQPSPLGGSAEDVFSNLAPADEDVSRFFQPSETGGTEALFGADPANNPAMQAALIGDVGTRAEDEADYLAEQEAAHIGPREAMSAYAPTTAAGEALKFKYQLDEIGRDRALVDEQREQQFQKELKVIGPDSAPSAVKEFKFAKQNGFAGSFEEWQKVSTTGSGAPANIREWEEFQRMSKPQQEQYLAMKREATRPWDRGGELIVPATPATPERIIEKTPTPGEMPQLRKDQAKAKTEGEEEVKGTVAEQKIDEEFAKEYAVGVAGGGYEDASKQVDQLESAIAELGTSEDLTGPARGMVPDFVRAFTNPKAVDIKERVEEVVQRNLRLILGAQFTEKEGERLISRAYNDRLQEDVNVARLNRLVGAMRKALAAKMSAAQHYEDNGTLRGWKGVLPKKSDFTGLDLDSPPQANLPAGVRSVQVVAD